MTTFSMIMISDIRLDGGTQVRAEKDLATVRDYCAAMVEGAVFPAVVVFDDGKAMWLADGFHRVEAAIGAGRAEIAADVRQGTLRDALVFALASNGAHGLRLSNVDKRRAVGLALDDEELSKWSDREISRWCGVTQPFVSKIRGERVITVITQSFGFEPEGGQWTPKEDHQAVGKALVNGTPCIAFVVPDARGDMWWVVVARINDGFDIVWTKKPVPADWVGDSLKNSDFPVDTARWEYTPVSSESDIADGGDDLGKRWSWPHIAFASRQEWIEKRWAA